jgi:hypothetical protein
MAAKLPREINARTYPQESDFAGLSAIFGGGSKGFEPRNSPNPRNERGVDDGAAVQRPQGPGHEKHEQTRKGGAAAPQA